MFCLPTSRLSAAVARLSGSQDGARGEREGGRGGEPACREK